MKRVLFFTLILLLSVVGHSKSGDLQDDIKVGDELTLGNPSTQQYQYIKFPKSNFIIKKGGIPNYKGLKGKTVVITKVSKDEKGNTIITFKRKDGKKFFKAIPQVSAYLEKGLESKEFTK